MTTSIQTPPETRPAPTAEQLARATQQKRFNFWFVYLPIALATIGVITLTVLMVIGVLSPMPDTSRLFISGLADLIIIFITLPLAFVCGAVPLGLIGFLIYRRQQKPEQPQAEKRQYGRLQTLFWKVEDLVVKSRGKSDELLPKVAQPIIRGNAIFAYLETMLTHLQQFLTRSNDGRQ